MPRELESRCSTTIGDKTEGGDSPERRGSVDPWIRGSRDDLDPVTFGPLELDRYRPERLGDMY